MDIDAIKEIIEDYWEDIAVFAYGKYLLKGRGAVAWGWDTEASADIGRFWYVTEQEVVQTYEDDLILVTKSYNPFDTVVIVIVPKSTNGQQSNYYIHYQKHPSPKIAYIQSCN